MFYFSIIVAMDKNRGIGKNRELPWHLSADMKHFAEVTKKTRSSELQNAVIMGRRTWESLPEKYRPLPQRLNIVLTRDKEYKGPQGVCTAVSLDQAMEKAQELKAEYAFVIGGGQIFEQAIQYSVCRRLYVTEIQQVFDCDTFFPQINPDVFVKEKESELLQEKEICFKFVEYFRIE